MFVKNNLPPIELDDLDMPNYLKDNLRNSWAHPFQKHIFPAINEERFSVLYSDDYASRPNTPINFIISLLIIKELFDQTDEEVIASLHFDDRYQYALRTINFEKQPVSINTFTDFRKRVYEYCKETGIDLIQLEIESLAKKIAEYLDIDNKQARMDSFMVDSYCANLSRVELVYEVNDDFIKLLNQVAPENIPEKCAGYLKSDHKKETIYKPRDEEKESKLEFLLHQSQLLYEVGLDIGKEITETEEFKLLARIIDEQIDDNDDSGFPIPKDNEDISSESLQNPSDPDATYRYKYGANIGYSANIFEQFNEENGVILHYDLKPNTYDDSEFSEDVIEKLPEQQNTISLLVDGGYYSHETNQKAEEKNINLIPSDLRGRKPDEDKMSCPEFTIDEEENIITNCVEGKTPISSNYDEETNTYTAKFSKEDCEGCPVFSMCRTLKQKKANTIRFTDKDYQIASLREIMETDEYQQLANKRAGIEGIPSTFRRKYNIDEIPVRGKLWVKIWLGFKVAAYNFKKLLKGLEDKAVSAISSLFFFIISILNLYNNKINLNTKLRKQASCR